jgi:FkbM family methyltransferase
MNKTIYNLLSKLIKAFLKGKVAGKKIHGLNKMLYYERSQHLTFFFKPEIKYEEIIQRKMRRYVKEGDVVFDIGANIGQSTMPLSEYVGNSGKVYSFEPDYKNFSFLQFNVNINKCSNVTCLNYGIGGENSEKEFYRDTETGGRTGSFKKEFVGENYKGFKEKVSVRSFDDIVRLFGEPDFVKIDVEGFEDCIADGLTIELQNCIFLVETREETKHAVFGQFNKRGFECLWIDGQDQLVNKADDIQGIANLIFKKPVAHQLS